jgi:hypothetical protein
MNNRSLEMVSEGKRLEPICTLLVFVKADQ